MCPVHSVAIGNIVQSFWNCSRFALIEMLMVSLLLLLLMANMTMLLMMAIHYTLRLKSKTVSIVLWALIKILSHFWAWSFFNCLFVYDLDAKLFKCDFLFSPCNRDSAVLLRFFFHYHLWLIPVISQFIWIANLSFISRITRSHTQRKCLRLECKYKTYKILWYFRRKHLRVNHIFKRTRN